MPPQGWAVLTNHSQCWVWCSCWCLTIADDICCFNREEIWSCWLWGKVASAGGPVWWPAITQVYHQCAGDNHVGDNHYNVNGHHGGVSDHRGKDDHDGGEWWWLFIMVVIMVAYCEHKSIISSVLVIIMVVIIMIVVMTISVLMAELLSIAWTKSFTRSSWQGSLLGEWGSHEKRSNLGQPSGSLGFDLVSNLENKRNLGRSSLWGPLLGQVVVFDVQTSEIKQTDAGVHKHTVEPAKTFDSPWELQTGLMGCFCSHNPWYRLCLDWKQVIYNRTEKSGFRYW